MNPGGLIHPDMLAELDAFYSSTCLIEEPTEVQDDYKEEIATWGTLHASIPCAIGPASGRGEVRLPDMSYVIATHRITLAGFYTDINETMRATVSGLVLSILLVAHDSHSETTHLDCEVIR